MILTILTPEKEVYKGAVSSVKVPGVTGQFEVLDHHAPIVSALGSGKIRVITSQQEKLEYEITKGFIEVLHNEVSLLVQGLKA